MTKKQKKKLIRILVSAALLVGFSFIPAENAWLRLGLFAVPYLIIGYDVLQKAFKGILNRQVFDEHFLMAIATVGALALAFRENGSYAEAIAVMLFYQVGELFESYAVGKSRRNISDLMDIRPDTAVMETENGAEEVDPEDVPVGSIIVVSAGEKIAIDGVVTEGETQLDTAALTGESVPRSVKPGDEVISGCINLSGVIRIRTTKEFGESTVSKILDLVENSSMKKAKQEKFISRFARIYTPAVCAAALLLAVVPPLALLLTGHSAQWEDWIYRALTFLVISCPCALVISIPLTFFAGIGGASREGILVKGATCLESLAQTRCVAFDKTGTLTKGVFEVNGVYPADGVSENDLLEAAAYAEAYSHHPIAGSLQTAYGKAVDKARVDSVNEISGHGVTAVVDGKETAVGNAKLMKKYGVTYSECGGSGTVVYVAQEGKFLGAVVIADTVKPTAREAITALKASGVKKTVMLTGDSRAVAEEVAAALGMDAVYSELLPTDKVDKVEALLAEKGKGETLAFVGDGINDAPVLSRADLGIAMGALGSDAAIEAADVVLMDDNPQKLPLAIRLSRRCLRIVHENIWFAIGIKLLCLVLGALGIANMWLAIFADVGVMVLAVLNAIRALKVKK